MEGTTKPANSTREGRPPNFNFPHMYGDEAISDQRKGGQGTVRGIERMDAGYIHALARRICRRGKSVGHRGEENPGMQRLSVHNFLIRL